MKYLFIFSICIVFASCSVKRFDNQSCLMWETVEWSIHNLVEEKNPFDIEAQAEFENTETGEKIITPLFYTGKQTWNFRFTATGIGKWRFGIKSSFENLNGWQGVVEVLENPNKRAHGFIKNLDGKWGWQGSEEAFVPQYVMGHDLDYYFDFENDKIDSLLIESEIQEFIIEHGFTGFHFLMGGKWFNLKDKKTIESPDVQSYKVLETFIAKVHKLGGGCHLWMWGSDGSRDKTDGEGPRGVLGAAGNEADLRNLRYLAARLGPLPGWTMGYGVDTENAVATKEQLNTWKNYLEKNMGWDHLIGARVGFDEKGLWALRPPGPRPGHDENFCSEIKDEHCFWLEGDYIGYTSYRPLYKRYREAILHQPQKPSFEEDRFRLRNRPNWEYKDYNEELTRHGLWHSAMAGGVANIWGNLLPRSEHRGSNPYPIKNQIKCYSLFFENRFLKSFQSKKEGNQIYLLSPENKHAIVYAEKTDEIDFSGLERYLNEPIIVVDAKKEYEETELILDTQSLIFKLPYTSDWGIAIGKFELN